MAWNWNNDSGYVAFDSTTNGIIEAAYAAGQSNVTLTHGFFAKVGFESSMIFVFLGRTDASFYRIPM